MKRAGLIDFNILTNDYTMEYSKIVPCNFSILHIHSFNNMWSWRYNGWRKDMGSVPLVHSINGMNKKYGREYTF